MKKNMIFGFFAIIAAVLLTCSGALGDVIWRPKRDVMRIDDAVRLSAAALAPEENLMLWSERIGGKMPPFSSKIIFFDPVNNQLKKVTFLENADILSMKFISSRRVLCEMGGNDDKREYRIFNLDGDEFERQNLVLPNGSDLTVGHGCFFYKEPGAKNIKFGSLEDISQESTVFGDVVGGVLMMPDKDLLVNLAEGKRQEFKFDGELWTARKPENFKFPAGRFMLIPIENTGRSFLYYPSDASSLHWHTDGDGIQLGGRFIANALAWKNQEKVLGVGSIYKDMVKVYKLENSIKPYASIALGKFKPLNTGEIFALFGSGDGFLVLDRRGIVCKIAVNRRGKWSKKVVYSPYKQ